MQNNIFINLTNHPSDKWDEKQIMAANQYGSIVDIPFPAIPAECDENYIKELGAELVKKILGNNPTAVLCQGEFTLAYYVISELRKKNIIVLAACSNRKVKEDGNKKIVEFSFERFREYKEEA